MIITPEQIYLLSDKHWCLILPYEKNWYTSECVSVTNSSVLIWNRSVFFKPIAQLSLLAVLWLMLWRSLWVLELDSSQIKLKHRCSPAVCLMHISHQWAFGPLSQSGASWITYKIHTVWAVSSQHNFSDLPIFFCSSGLSTKYIWSCTTKIQRFLPIYEVWFFIFFF